MSSTPSPASRLFTFVAGSSGPWTVDAVLPVVGDPIAAAPKLAVIAGPRADPDRDATWSLRGTTSNERYVEHDEKSTLVEKQEGLGRPAASRAALIPIRKNAAWWALAQDERRAIFEAQSHHIAIGLRYLPAVARRLHHCRDLGSDEPFDFLTWFEYAPEHEPVFDELLAALRASPEWRYIDREVDIRLVRTEG